MDPLSELIKIGFLLTAMAALLWMV